MKQVICLLALSLAFFPLMGEENENQTSSEENSTPIASKDSTDVEGSSFYDALKEWSELDDMGGWLPE